MALSKSVAIPSRPVLGVLIQDVAAALRAHIQSQDLGPHIEANVLKALSTGGRLLESEDSAALATLVMLAAETTGASQETGTVPVAVAMECLMAAADILDDIQDDELEVKGWESAAVASETLSALLVLSHGAIASAAVDAADPRPFVRAQHRLARFEAVALRGQAEDVRSTPSAMTQADMLAITRAKSGALGRCAAEIGACLGTSDESVIRHFGDFGEHLAVVFQLMNDIAGIWPGHESGADLSGDRPTAVLGFIHDDRGATAHVKVARNALARAKGAERESSDVRQAVARSGAVHFAWALASVELTRARRKSHLIETLFHGSRLAVLLRR